MNEPLFTAIDKLKEALCVGGLDELRNAASEVWRAAETEEGPTVDKTEERLAEINRVVAMLGGQPDVTEPTYTMTLSRREMKVLTALIAAYDDEDDDSYTTATIRHIKDAARRQACQSFKFVNVYDYTQQYGGAEEGGWYYTTTECVRSYGVAVCSERDLHRLIELFIEMSIEWCDTVYPSTIEATAEIYQQLVSLQIVQSSQLDKYGAGYVVRVEDEPGESEDTSTRIYS